MRILRQTLSGFNSNIKSRIQKKNPYRKSRGFIFFGGSGEIRTRDQRIKSPLLYRLSYRPNPNKQRL